MSHPIRKTSVNAVLTFFILLVLFAAPQILFAENEDDVRLSLSKAVEFALNNNPDIESAKAVIKRRDAEKQQATARFLPVVDVYTDYVRGDSPSSSLFTAIDKRELPAGVDFNNPGIFENYESGIRARITLFNGGKNYLGRKAADDFLSAAHAESRSVINQITAEVMKSWFNLLSTERFITISEESVQTIQKQLEIMTVRYKGGSVLKSDILSLKVRLAEAEEELIKNRSRNSLSKAAFAVLLGLSPEKNLIIDRSSNGFLPFEKHVMDSLATSAVRRPELVQADKMMLGTKKSADAAKRFYTPTIALAGKYYLDDEEMKYSTDRENWTMGIMMNWNIFSGLTGLAEKKKAAADLLTARQAKRKAELNVQLDIKKSALILEDAKARLKVSEKNKEFAEESLTLVRKQYEGGAVGITRYLDAELAYSRAQTSLATARFDRMAAIVETARAGGFLSDPGFLIIK